VIRGHVRGFLPRVLLSLPGRNGDPVIAEFIVDTAFEGSLAMPTSLLAQLDATYVVEQSVRVATGSVKRCAIYDMTIDWHGEPRQVDVIVMDNDPLLGAILLHGSHVSLEMDDGGDVMIDEL
jgi:clan AA aspartic protease